MDDLSWLSYLFVARRFALVLLAVRDLFLETGFARARAVSFLVALFTGLPNQSTFIDTPLLLC